jgi:single-stranded-DNA-specific exonuclease
VERWRRPCVAIALDGEGGGRGSGRSISSYDLHAGLTACAAHLTRFGGHRMAAGVELAADEVEPFRRALAAHAGAALAPDDLIPVERVDAVVPGGVLGLELAEELETLRPFGMGNAQPTLLVPAARFQNVTAMGEEREHSRFTLVTAGGARSRGVAFRSPPSRLAPAGETNHDIALRLERNRWNGVVEPRTILRALCPTRPGALTVLGEDGGFWERLARAREPAPVPAGTGPEPVDRRREGFAGVAGDLFSSGERVLVVVADVERRRRGLEEIVAGLACGGGRRDAEPGAPATDGPHGAEPGAPADGMPVATWAALAADPRLAASHDHLVALDPPPGGSGDPLLRAGPEAHLAWGPAEAEFALQVWRAELDLRPALADAFLRLRELPAVAPPEAIQAALEGAGRYPRSPQTCARIVDVLTELGLIELRVDPPSCSVVGAERTELERSATYRAGAERLAAIGRALAPELPQRHAARAA